MEPTVSTSADGVVHITAEFELPGEDEQVAPAAPQSDPVADVLSGVARGVGIVLGAVWDAIKPDGSEPPAEESEEE